MKRSRTLIVFLVCVVIVTVMASIITYKHSIPEIRYFIESVLFSIEQEKDSYSATSTILSSGRTYYSLNGILIPAYNKGQLSHYINFNLTLVIKTDNSILTMAAQDSQMRSALLHSFSNLPITVYNSATDFNEDLLRKRLFTSLFNIVGDNLRTVLITSAMPLNF